MSTFYAVVAQGEDIPAEYEWEKDRASAEEQAVGESRANSDIYRVIEITTREIGRTRISVVLDTV